MRDDLLDAKAAVHWAVTQIPLLQQRFLEWQQRNPYRIVQERDSQTGDDVAVAYQQIPFPLTLNAEVGAIINSMRSGLDLLGAALATRNGVKPSHETHFPIFRSLHDMIDPLEGIEGKKWLSQSERTTIKGLKPYNRGDDTLWSLHQLDILRKHERLISASPKVEGYLMLGRRFSIGLGGAKAIRREKDKTILLRLGPGEILDAAQGNTLLAAFITFNESALGLDDQEVATVLRKFAARVAAIIELFDTP